MIDELERIREEAVVAYVRYYTGICMKGMSKTTISLSEESSCTG
jgi:hypothetical protein